MDTKQFLVQGSRPEPYKVIFKKKGGNLTGLCNCRAGQFGLYCKHRTSILKGETKGIVSGNETDVDIVLSWLSGSDVEQALNEVKDAELQLESAKRVLKGKKKKFANALKD